MQKLAEGVVCIINFCRMSHVVDYALAAAGEKADGRVHQGSLRVIQGGEKNSMADCNVHYLIHSVRSDESPSL
jgi:hypothetical protein